MFDARIIRILSAAMRPISATFRVGMDPVIVVGD